MQIQITQVTSIFFVSMLCLSFHSLAGTPSTPTTVLYADFNELTPGDTIGEGGPALGEPVHTHVLTTEIIEVVPGEHALLVEKDPGITGATRMRWEFLDNIEITEGQVVIAFDFTPSSLDGYSFGVRENGGSSRSFLSISYSNTGTLSVTDSAGLIPLSSNTWVAGDLQSVEITFDMDAGTSTLSINDDVLFSAREHGITDRGVGRLLTGFNSGANGDYFVLDNLSVTAPVDLPLILDVDLEQQMIGQMIGTGGAVLGEPVSITPGVLTEIITTGVNDQALLVSLSNSGGSRAIRWEFLNQIELSSGIVVIEMDVHFDVLDRYQVLIREQSSNASSFLNLRFNDQGLILASDGGGFIGTLGVYEIDRVYRLNMSFDMDNETYSIRLDGELLLENRSHGVSSGRGIGAVLTGFQSNSSTTAAFVIDDLQVGATFIRDDIIFSSDFD